MDGNKRCSNKKRQDKVLYNPQEVEDKSRAKSINNK